mgnify:CR=1 FL=1
MTSTLLASKSKWHPPPRVKIWFPTREQIETASHEDYISIVQYATKVMLALSGKKADDSDG